MCAALLAGACCASRADTPASPTPSLADRVSDLEAYVTNGARQTNAPTALAESAGPRPQRLDMTSAALVLFMTLPGLALFYGGLVRRKNVLSVLAQCLGIAGLVTILWWLCGYSIAFHSGQSLLGIARLGVSARGRFQAEHGLLAPGFRTTSSPCISSCSRSSRRP